MKKTRLASAINKGIETQEALTYDELDLFNQMVLKATFPGQMSDQVSALRMKLERMKAAAGGPPPEPTPA